MAEYGEQDRRWVNAKWKEIRTSQRAADDANNGWRRLTNALNHKLDREGVTDIVARDRITGENLTLAGYLDAGKWHSQNAQRHIDDVRLFIELKREGLLP